MRLKLDKETNNYYIFSKRTGKVYLCPESGFTHACGSQCPFFALNEDFNRVTLSCKDYRLFIPLEKEEADEKGKVVDQGRTDKA